MSCMDIDAHGGILPTCNIPNALVRSSVIRSRPAAGTRLHGVRISILSRPASPPRVVPEPVLRPRTVRVRGREPYLYYDGVRIAQRGEIMDKGNPMLRCTICRALAYPGTNACP